MNPRQLCEELDRYIIGQSSAKRAVSIALRSRWRRKYLPDEIRSEVTPKNILMVGPTGCGKTEIARRLAKLCGAPFIKVEATKFTEVGYHGKDVDQIIKDLVNAGIHQAKQNLRELTKKFTPEITEIVDNYLVAQILGPSHPDDERREKKLEELKAGRLDMRNIFVEVPDLDTVLSRVSNENMSIEEYVAVVRNLAPNKTGKAQREKMTVADARKMGVSLIIDGFVRDKNTVQDALQAVQEHGIVFIDEIDKIATAQDAIRTGTNPSAEGVQRDLLPLIEGTMINTKHGDVNTDHILFIASGAFSECKPSDLLPELQGRLPIRVNLSPLSKEEFIRILKETKNSLITQNIELMKTEGINLSFTDEAIEKIAEIAFQINTSVENTGARRLMTILEKVMEDVSFDAPNIDKDLQIDASYVESKTKDMFKQVDIRKHLL
jgi:ATP-dependent HslUV protease ATP-binding subunit HslU